MPISTTIDSPAALYALMTTSDTTDLAQSYIQTANIDMTDYTSESIAHDVGPTFYDFSGIYDGAGYTITIGNVVSTYTGLFNSLARPISGIGGIVKNVNVIYQNTISNILSTDTWGGLVGEMAVCSIQNCSVTINAILAISVNQNNSDIGAICGFMGQNSSITNTRLIINNTIQLEGRNDSDVGLICGQNSNSSITNCSITTGSTSFDISLKTGQSVDSVAGLICGGVYDSFTALDIPVLQNITVNLNNNGRVIIDNISAANPPTPLGAFCGTMNGDGAPGTDIFNCSVNINNNQILVGAFNDFFGQVLNTVVVGCQFSYTTTTNNTYRPLTITPAPSPVATVTYVNSYTGIYTLTTGSYYIPNGTASVTVGPESLSLQSQSPGGIIINSNLYSTNSTFSSSNITYIYSIFVKGVGSMYFDFDIGTAPITDDVSCICQFNNVPVNPQTGISASSRITNAVEDKTIRVNVDREFRGNSVVYPKFKTYSDYIKYLQGGLRQ